MTSTYYKKISALIILMFSIFGTSHAVLEQKTFSAAEIAVNDFIKSLKENDSNELLAIFGPDANELINSGDPVADSQRRQIFINAYNIMHKLEPDKENKLVLVVGEIQWPFPIPLVKQGQQWIFDTEAGKEEILNRRIGFNELFTIHAMLAIVDAQCEYAMQDRDGDGIREYAQKFKSDPNTTNGLYWETKKDQKPSPLGVLIATARQQGYFTNDDPNEPQPYHGYFYRMLTAQGPNAKDGKLNYIVNDNMIGGFAVIAYPAEYGNSGVMTFIVNYDGIVYQKDLGENTEEMAQNITLFDPDKTWTKVKGISDD